MAKKNNFDRKQGHLQALGAKKRTQTRNSR